MPVRALTIDFWNTMVVARTGGERRQAQRMSHLVDLVRAGRPEATEIEVDHAYRTAIAHYDAAWRKERRTPRTSSLVRCIWDALALEIEEDRHAETVTLFEDGLLHGAPDFADGLEEALAWAAGRYRMGIVSDTMFSPGRVIRQLLERRGVLRYFDAFVFSDETGFSKPDPRALTLAAGTLGVGAEEIAHIGDLRRTDVQGARAVEATALLFTHIHCEKEDGPEPDAVLPHWEALPDVLAGV